MRFTNHFRQGESKLSPSQNCILQVDATEEGNKALATKFGVQGFPTLKVGTCPSML